MTEISLRVGQPLRMASDQTVQGVTYELVESFIAPSASMANSLPRRLNAAVDRFVEDWKSVH